MGHSGKALTQAHDVRSFDCGTEILNTYLSGTARQHIPKGVSKTFVVENPDNQVEILGYYTLAIRRMVPSEDLPPSLAKRLPRDVPAITLARLAVDKKMQGKGLGEHMLVEAMQRAYQASEHIGGWGLFVDAKDEKAAAFYRKYGFTPLPSNPLILVIPLASIPRV